MRADSPIGRGALLAAVGLYSLLSSSCGGGDSTGSNPAVATVTVTPNPADVHVGDTLRLTATLKDASGSVLSGRTTTWTSSATDRATVDADGLVTGVAEGEASITAASEGKTGTTTTRVSELPPGLLDGIILPRGAKTLSDTIYFLSRAVQNRLEWARFALHDPVPPNGTTGGFSGGSTGGFVASARPGAAGTTIEGATSSVLFAGGYLNGNSANASAQAVLYEPTTGETTPIQMTAARTYHTMTLLSGTRALLAGGFDGDVVLSSAEIFDETTRQFTATGSMGVARARHAAALLPDGRVLITGGLVPVGGGPATDIAKSTEIFDPVSGTFTPGPDMAAARFNHSAIALDDGRVLVLGGNGLKSAEAYDPASGTFSPVGDMEVSHGLGHQAVKLLGGRVLVVGGDSTNHIQPSAVAEVFDPATDEFLRVGDMTTTRMLHFAVLFQTTGEVVIGGGQDASGNILKSAEVYDPTSNSFTAIEDMPAPGSEQEGVFVSR
jgi:hypothetical protein